MNAIFRKFRQRSFLLAALLLMGCLQLLAQTRTIKGVVTDAQNGDPLIGATIMVEGEKAGTYTVTVKVGENSDLTYSIVSVQTIARNIHHE